jgi:exodeoxyribonuclease-1
MTVREFAKPAAQAMAARFPEDPAAPPPPVEKLIYGGFYSQADKALLAEFQRADWRRRQEIIATLGDGRLRQLGRRLVAFHAPELLSAEEGEQFEAWLRDRWSVPASPDSQWTGLAKAHQALADMRVKGAASPEAIDEIADYLQRFEA